MIERYAVKVLNDIWNNQTRLELWWKIELAVIKGWYQLKLIPSDDYTKLIKAKVVIDQNRMLEIEEQTKHDVIAFTRMIDEQLGLERKWVHLGLTSTDIVDTAQNYQIKLSNEIVLKTLEELIANVLKKALTYKKQLIMGRTHGMYGEPTSLGLKFLLWYDELLRQKQRINNARKTIEVTKISGSMGNYAHIEPEIDEVVAKELGLDVDSIGTQVTQRDRHIELLSCFANLATTLEKMAVELRHWQRSEINEAAEGFKIKQKGSSSMPHKKNPISSENICGLARLIRSYANTSYENNLLWHERDISHSSNERIIISDCFHLIVYILNRMNDVIKNLVINTEVMNKRIDSMNHIYFSQVLMTKILKQTNYSREEVYDYLQKMTFFALKNNQDLIAIIKANDIQKYLPIKTINKLINNNYFLRNVDKIYKKVLSKKSLT
ncbi:adenylosuccinate lyase [[Mycoplasma] testudinis]|uniref:adenylosuccinate lyase n=1 Tax=[Mycoplasma] testudinis TaxID=33924 RepID=UPI000487C13E|nr:adenylosuccinate lyase [[Mycoplasma] testudinis]